MNRQTAEKSNKKILYVATVVKKHIMEFHQPYIRMMSEEGWQVDVAAANDYADPADCRIPCCTRYFAVPFDREPLSPGNYKAYRMLRSIIEEGDYDLIHCNTPTAAFLTRLAAKRARKNGTRVIYTAHGFHFFHGAPLKNWIAYCPVEWIASWLTDVLITINEEDLRFARKHFHAKSTVYVPGVGIDPERFRNALTSEDEREQLRQSFGIGQSDVMVLSVGELVDNKNHEPIIRAMAELSGEHIHYVICGEGENMERYRALVRELGLSDRVTLAGYRNDIHKVCACADIFIHPSKREGLPVAVMEAMAAGLPVIGTDIRGTRDLLEKGNGGIILSPTSEASDYAEAIRELSGAPEDLRRYGDVNRQNAEQYRIGRLQAMIREIYDRAEHGNFGT